MMKLLQTSILSLLLFLLFCCFGSADIMGQEPTGFKNTMLYPANSEPDFGYMTLYKQRNMNTGQIDYNFDDLLKDNARGEELTSELLMEYIIHYPQMQSSPNAAQLRQQYPTVFSDAPTEANSRKSQN